MSDFLFGFTNDTDIPNGYQVTAVCNNDDGTWDVTCDLISGASNPVTIEGSVLIGGRRPTHP